MKGFTLVEILVVVAILALAGVIMVVIFANTLRGSSKSQILGVIKQNGQAALDKMDKTIRNADNVICQNSNTLVIIKDGIYTRFRFIDISSQGKITEDHPTPPAGDITSWTAAVCTDPPDPAASILTDTNPKTGVKVETGNFQQTKPAGFKAQVEVSFTLAPPPQAPSVIAGQIDSVKFQTTVQLR